MSQNGTKPRRLHWRNFESFRSKGTYLMDPYTCLRIKHRAARAPMWWRCTRISSKTIARWHIISTALEHSQGYHGCHWVSGSDFCPIRLISLSLGEQTSLLFLVSFGIDIGLSQGNSKAPLSAPIIGSRKITSKETGFFCLVMMWTLTCSTFVLIVCLAGFSRGAYEVRALSAMIDKVEFYGPVYLTV